MSINKTTKVIFVSLLAVATLVIVLSYVGQRYFGRGKDYAVRFDQVNGLARGAGVFHRGLEVGRVVDMSIEPGGNGVRVLVEVKPAIELRRDAEIFITTHGLLGEGLVEIWDVGHAGEPVSEGDVIEGRESANFGRIIARVSDIVEKVAANERKITAWLENLTTTVEQLRAMDQRLERLEQKLDRLLVQTIQGSKSR